MIVPGQLLETTWVPANKYYFIDKGYEFTGFLTKFIVSVEDLSPCSNVKIDVICDFCGEHRMLSYANYTIASRAMGKVFCKKCGQEHARHSTEFVIAEFIARGYTPLFTSYSKNTDMLDYICNRHPDIIQTIKYRSFREGKGCYYCGRLSASKNMTGSLNHNWKGTRNEFTVLRTSVDMHMWKKAVFTKDNFRCVRCGINSNKLNAHHIRNFSDYPDYRFDVDNGATLCYECHISKYYNSFHHIYGVKNNTEEQFKEFMKTTKQLL